MTFTTFSALNTAEWLFMIFIISVVGAIFAWAILGFVLEIKYSGPYTVANASGKEKWRRSTILALVQTGILPITGLLQLILVPYVKDGLILPMFCGGIWIIAFPLDILYQRWDFERKIKRYQKIDKLLKDEKDNQKNNSPLTKFIKIFMTAEMQRFINEGYSKEFNDKSHLAKSQEN